MRMWMKSRVSCPAAVLIWICMASGLAAAASGPQYLVTNDDVAPFFFTGVSFFTVGAGGTLKLDKEVQTGGSGTGGGFFGANRVAVLNQGTSQCVYASEGSTGDIVGIVVGTLEVGGSAFGSDTDGGTTNGIGLVMNPQYIYASFTDSNTIGTFQVQPGCSLTFVNDVSVVGLQSGVIDGMAIHGNTLVATYGDGSIESFDIASGPPVSNGDKQNSTGAARSAFASYPTSVKITEDGHYAIFGDTTTSSLVEVSDISSGKLAAPVTYNLGTGINSSNILLSPDETLLYIANTQGDRITAAFFNPTTGKLSTGCASGKLHGYVTNWSYLGSLALEQNTGTGGVLYVAEFGMASGIAIINVTSVNGKCTLTEASNSPVPDPFSTALLSIGMFPPPTF
jgi:6-phosphogluconolactonase (cycloisomerase 2 family)